MVLSKSHPTRWPLSILPSSKPIWKQKSKTFSLSSELKSAKQELKCKKWFVTASLSSNWIYSLRQISNFSRRVLMLSLPKKKKSSIWSATKDALLILFAAVSLIKVLLTHYIKQILTWKVSLTKRQICGTESSRVTQLQLYKVQLLLKLSSPSLKNLSRLISSLKKLKNLKKTLWWLSQSLLSKTLQFWHLESVRTNSARSQQKVSQIGI